MNDMSKKPAALEFVAPDGKETIAGILEAAAARQPDKALVVFPDYDGYRMSYKAALAGARQVALALRAKGIGPGGRVAVYLGNEPCYVWAWMATLLMGATDVSVNPDAKGASLTYALNKARVDAIITNREGIAGLETVTESSGEPIVLVLDNDEAALTDGPLALAWGDWQSPGEPVRIDPGVELRPGKPLGLSSIRFTSGSTGFPKGVMLSQAHMLAKARMFSWMTEFGESDVLYTSFPVHHVFSTVMGLLPALNAGGTLVLARKFSARNFWDHVRRYGATIAHLLDAPAAILMSMPESDQDRQHQCRCVFSLSIGVPRFEARFGVKNVWGYEMSELISVANYPPDVPYREGSVGVASPAFEVAIIDDDDFPVPAGIEGQIVVRPRVPHVMMLGYFDDADLVVERWGNLWFHTNDKGYLDADGYFYFTGRLGDRIRRRGVNVSAAEVEAVALMHPDVAEAAVIGVPSEMGEDDIKVCVTLKAGRSLSPAAILDVMKPQLSSSQVPRYVEIRDDFPRTDTEKIRKNVLRDEGSHGLTESTWDTDTGEFVSLAGLERR